LQFHAASLRLAPLGAGAVHPINGKLRDELLSVEIFNSLREAQILIESWRRHYNAIRPHSALGYRPPAPAVIVSALTAWLQVGAKLKRGPAITVRQPTNIKT
jgi:hypothetical protein